MGTYTETLNDGLERLLFRSSCPFIGLRYVLDLIVSFLSQLSALQVFAAAVRQNSTDYQGKQSHCE